MTSVLNFLTSMYEGGIGHSQINKARSALSVIYPDIAINKHPLISRVVQGVCNLQSGQVKCLLLWDVNDLRNHLISWNISSDSSVQYTSCKAYCTRATFVFQTWRHVCLRKCCPCALVKDRDFCVSKIVGEIKHVKSGKLFFKHKIQRTGHFVCLSHVSRTIKHDTTTRHCSWSQP